MLEVQRHVRKLEEVAPTMSLLARTTRLRTMMTTMIWAMPLVTEHEDDDLEDRLLVIDTRLSQTRRVRN